jgi:ABC-2 type transport system ATP-binding protein
MQAISVRDLRKTYDGVEAVRGAGFDVAAGEVFCLLGPNGAGKTTTVEILEGYRLRDGGEARVLGHDPADGSRELRERMGIVLQDSGLQQNLSVGEMLEMYARWYPRPRPIDEVIELVELDARRADRIPDLWQDGRAHDSLHGRGPGPRRPRRRDGEIVAAGTPAELGGRDALPAEIRFTLPAGVGPSELPDLFGVTVTHDDRDGVLVTAADGVAAAHAITGWALERGIGLTGFAVAQPTLEDVYLALTEPAAAEVAR